MKKTLKKHIIIGRFVIKKAKKNDLNHSILNRSRQMGQYLDSYQQSLNNPEELWGNAAKVREWVESALHKGSL
ncbi:MAG: hypothetical protein COB62_06985, partial [Piscirickettsiaceae bacterium]